LILIKTLENNFHKESYHKNNNLIIHNLMLINSKEMIHSKI